MALLMASKSHYKQLTAQNCTDGPQPQEKKQTRRDVMNMKLGDARNAAKMTFDDKIIDSISATSRFLSQSSASKIEDELTSRVLK